MNELPTWLENEFSTKAGNDLQKDEVVAAMFHSTDRFFRTADVQAKLGCDTSQDTVRSRLNELEDEGLVYSEKMDETTCIWQLNVDRLRSSGGNLNPVSFREVYLARDPSKLHDMGMGLLLSLPIFAVLAFLYKLGTPPYYEVTPIPGTEILLINLLVGFCITLIARKLPDDGLFND